MRRNVIVLLALACLAVLLSGCALSYKRVTSRDEEIVTEYGLFGWPWAFGENVVSGGILPLYRRTIPADMAD
jgi:hypothetical protein